MTDYIEQNRKVLFLAKCYLFADLTFEELDQLAESTKIRTAQPNEVIFHKNDKGSEMFFIVRGKVSLTASSESGRELSFGALGEGNIFGEISLFDSQERTATITAMEPTLLLVLERAPFLAFIGKNPDIALKLLSAMAGRLRYTDQIFENTVFGPLHVRLAKKLLALEKVFGEDTTGGIKLTIKLSFAEIAKMLGSSQETVKEQMLYLENKRLIKYRNGYVTICDEDAMNALVSAG